MSVLTKFRAATKNKSTGCDDRHVYEPCPPDGCGCHCDWCRNGGKAKKKSAISETLKKHLEVKPWEKNGAHRRDEKGNYYWLTGEQCAELAVLNEDIPDNEEGDAIYWKKFAKFRKKYGLNPVTGPGYYARGGTSSYQKPAQTKAWDEYWDDPIDTKQGKSLSSWWSHKENSYFSTSYVGGQEAARLAIAMKAVESVVRVIDDSGVRMMVVPANDTDGKMSYTDFDNKKIVVNPVVMKDTSLSEGEQIDVLTSEGLHEASHSKYTRPLDGVVKDPTIKPKGLSQILLNILEDVRIERLTSEEFPGFAPYFVKGNAYLWNKAAKKDLVYGEDLLERLNAIIAICKWPEEIKPLITPENQDEVEWWQAWCAAYAGTPKSAHEQIRLAIEHLRLPSPRESEGDGEGEGKGSKSGKPGDAKPKPGEGDPGQGEGESEPGEPKPGQGQASAKIDEWIKAEELRKKILADSGYGKDSIVEDAVESFRTAIGDQILDFCSHRQHKGHEKVNQSVRQQEQKLRDEDIREWNATIHDTGSGEPSEITISKPSEDTQTKRLFQNDVWPDPFMSKYQSALVFRQAKPQHTISLLKEGDISEDEVWRWAADDWRVFEDRIIETAPNTRLYLLVDMSGSMNGSASSKVRKVDEVRRITRMFVEALRTMDGVTPKVFGHTGDVLPAPPESNGNASFYRIWEEGDPISRLGVIGGIHMGNNYDGYALEWVGEQIDQEGDPSEQKIIIVISDGHPAGHSYGNMPAYEHVHAVVDHLKRKDIRVLQIAIDPQMQPERQALMYDEFIPYDKARPFEAVPAKLTKWLEKIL